MKLAEVVPLYKRKEHYLENNYRSLVKSTATNIAFMPITAVSML